MTKKELLKELGLDSSYIIHEYVETDKVIFVIVNRLNLQIRYKYCLDWIKPQKPSM